MKFKRMCIYPKDVQLITGKSERYGRKLLKEIKVELKKDKRHFVSLEEFCQYTGLDPEQVEKYLSS